jgi:hypothetical protein
LADPSSVSIVIPAYNESASIAEVVSVLRGAAPVSCAFPTTWATARR